MQRFCAGDVKAVVVWFSGRDVDVGNEELSSEVKDKILRRKSGQGLQYYAWELPAYWSL